MGINTDIALFMLAAKQSGASFQRCLTLGRQWWFGDWVKLAPKALSLSVTWPDTSSPDRTAWADDFFRALGADTLDVLDNSPYEGAAILHDLNQPLPSSPGEGYDVVYDGGTLEHVFHYATGIHTCMKLVKKGGHLCLWTPANNELGHGFYQLGPELFPRLFCEAHGYRLCDLVLVEQRMRDTRWYRVADPARLGARVGCVNSHPLFFMVLAQRIGDELPDQLNVQQADYVEAWKEVDRTAGVEATNPQAPPKANGFLRRWLPTRWEAELKRYYRRYWVLRLGNRTFYEPLNKGDYQMLANDHERDIHERQVGINHE